MDGLFQALINEISTRPCVYYSDDCSIDTQSPFRFGWSDMWALLDSFRNILYVYFYWKSCEQGLHSSSVHYFVLLQAHECQSTDFHFESFSLDCRLPTRPARCLAKVALRWTHQ